MTDDEEEGVWKWSSTGKISESKPPNRYYSNQTLAEINEAKDCALINVFLPADKLLRESGPFWGADLDLDRVNCSEEINIICEKQ